jgi:protein-S-isoprenylcysteine O-methyltransferase Ste14
MNLIKSILHNIGVLVVSFAFALIGVVLDYLFGIGRFNSTVAIAAGSVLLAAGFLLRVWATYHFYQHNMKVIVLSAQQSLITDGPYRFSRHPLYLGGNVFMFLGATLVLGTPSGVVLTIAHLPIVDWMMRREEKQLAQKFGEEWTRYTHKVRRWL